MWSDRSIGIRGEVADEKVYWNTLVMYMMYIRPTPIIPEWFGE